MTVGTNYVILLEWILSKLWLLKVICQSRSRMITLISDLDCSSGTHVTQLCYSSYPSKWIKISQVDVCICQLCVLGKKWILMRKLVKSKVLLVEILFGMYFRTRFCWRGGDYTPLYSASVSPPAGNTWQWEIILGK